MRPKKQKQEETSWQSLGEDNLVLRKLIVAAWRSLAQRQRKSKGFGATGSPRFKD
jgi:hypothetical protein